HFQHVNGAFGKKYLPETMGSGCAFFDFDSDGDQDILLVNGTSWPDAPRAASSKKSTAALYRNRGDGTFEDVTSGSGLDRSLYGMGAAIGDFDSDDDPDVYLTALGPNVLFRNDGGGKFTDVTSAAGVGDPGFGASATWLDYDRDGDLDLFFINYVEWSRETDIYCSLDGKTKAYCTPESYNGASPVLYRNEGNGKFTNTSREAGLHNPRGKGLGVAVLDFDQDGNLDLAVANDTQPNNLYKNNGNGTFTDVGVLAGIAFAETGVARGAMGIDAGDFDGSGRESLVIGNFSNEMISLYHNEGKGFFIDTAPVSEVGRASLLTLKFAAFFFDFDLDGQQDIFVANGHVENDIQAVQQRVTYAQPPHLFWNLGGGRFRDVAAEVGTELGRPVVARGAAYGDIDADGDPDLLVTTSGGPAYLYRNDLPGKRSWIGFRLKGSSNNREGIGARLRLTAGGKTQTVSVKTGTGYLSQNQLPVTFGLGSSTSVTKLEVLWPSGKVQTLDSPAPGRIHVVEER
ncbi:MAG TPA: CRTAC1 family protein, partial [Vicinamibacteria bacterium]|nr:CRTAC1 family protein [Vicinamibacteria bacterium]